ncbi:MAG: hypothetical protein RPR97_07645 [Colwellia sp.]|jgi:hypothetical protein
MKHERVVSDKFDAIKFRAFVDEFKGKYKFPASEGHLCDLASTFKSGNEEYIKEDLDFLGDISNGIMLGIQDADEKLILIKGDIKEQFKEVALDNDPEPVFSVTGESHEVNMQALPSGSLLRPLLEKNSGIIDSKLMEDFLGSIWENIDNPEFYKKFRVEIANLSDTFSKTDTILSQESSYFKRIEAFMKIGEISDLNILADKFCDIFVSFLAIDDKKLENLKLGEKIQSAYAILDFSPLFRDKINKKNKPSNMYRDIKNLIFASGAKYYVTEDDATYKKSKFILKALNVKTRVVKMDELRFALMAL